MKTSNTNNKFSLQTKEDGQEYGRVIKFVGGSRIKVMCLDGVERLCLIRNSMKKKKKQEKYKITPGDYVLVSFREFNMEGVSDIILKYTSDEVRQLKKLKEIPENDIINEEISHNIQKQIADEEVFVFEDL